MVVIHVCSCDNGYVCACELRVMCTLCVMEMDINIREWTGLEFAKSMRAVENREKWRL